MNLSRSVLSLLAVVALAATGCAGETTSDAEASAPEGAPLVVATTTILADLVGELAGDAVTVEALMAPGQDPHGFAPSAKQAQRLREADLVVAFGLGLEEAADDALQAAEEDGVPVVHVAEAADPLGIGESAEEHAAHADETEDHDENADEDEGHEEHDHEDGDPHVWFDPIRMAEGMTVVSEALAEIAPDAADWDARAESLADELDAVDDEVAGILADVPDQCRLLVTNHDNLRYLAERYDLEVIGTVLPGTSTSAEPSAQDFAELAELLEETGAPAVFAETTQSSRLAESLVAEVGRDVAVVELFTDSLGEPGSGADTYAGMMTTDARRIADALADCA